MKVRTIVCFLGCGLLAVSAGAQILGRGGLGGGVAGGASSMGAGAAAGGAGSIAGSIPGRVEGQGALAGQASAGSLAPLQSDAHLYSRAQTMLPAGSSVESAAAGFQNQNDFFAALKASQNVGVPFDRLKANFKGSGSGSLESAIRKSRPDLSKAEAKADTRAAETDAARTVAAAHVEDQLSAKAGLDARAHELLPAGTSMSSAVYGFSDARDFVMAEHLSQNMNIPFDQLRTSVSGQDHAQFDTALAHLGSGFDSATVKSNIKTADKETNADFKASGKAEAGANVGRSRAQSSAGASADAQVKGGGGK